MCENYEMPTPCQKCGETFNLHDGTGSEKWFPNTVICSKCGIIEEEEIEKDQETQEQVDCVQNAIWDLINSGKELNRLHSLHKLSKDHCSLVLTAINDLDKLKNTDPTTCKICCNQSMYLKTKDIEPINGVEQIVELVYECEKCKKELSADNIFD